MFQRARTLLLATALVVSQATPNSYAAAPVGAPKMSATTAESTEDEVPDKPTTTAKADPAAEKYWQAIKLLNSKQASELEKGREALQAAADLEYPHAQSLLAECLMTGGYGFPKDKRKAANLYRLAAERGNAFAQVSLGQCYYSGTGVRKDTEKAAQWLSKALAPAAEFARPTPPPDFIAEQAVTASTGSEVAGQLDRDPVGDSIAAAHYILGEIAGADKKAEEAQKHFVAAATAGIDGRSGIYPAAVQAALNYAFGQGTPRDMVKANELLEISKRLTERASIRIIRNYSQLKLVDDFAVADLEEQVSTESAQLQTGAQFAIASAFTDKKSKDYNPTEAVKWFELAAENGNPWAMLNLAFLYSGRELGLPDPAKAFAWFERVGGGDKPKHYLGTANLAICLYNGIGTAKDIARAETLFKKSAREEYICHLGTLGQCPVTVLTWDQRISLIETNATSKKDPVAMYYLGMRNLNGWDIKPNLGDGVKWLKKSAKYKHGPAFTRLGLIHEFNPSYFDETQPESEKAAADFYRQAAEANDPDGMANYANMLNSGRGVEADSAKAEQLYINCLAIIPNHARAHNNLASIYEDRLLRTQSKDGNLLAAMFHHYEEAAKGENAYAARNLARIYRTGNLVTKDLHKAYGFYEQATEWGLPEHHYDLGYMLETGEGVPLSYTEAAYHYRLASTNGQPSQDALERLCNLYLSYNLGPNDPARTAFWLEILLRYRKDSPQFVIREGELALVRYSNDDLRVELLDSLLQAKNYKLAINMLKDADENGSEYMASFACERLSQCYKNGLGVKPSPRKSKKYYEKALAAQNCDALLTLSNQQFQDGKIQDALESLKKAAHASGKACFTLGQLYYNGTYVKQNQPQAVKYMKKAVDHFCPEAYYFFAEAAYNGAYGAPSLDEAIRLAQRAQSSGYPQATELLEKLEKRRKSTNDGAPEETARARSS